MSDFLVKPWIYKGGFTKFSMNNPPDSRYFIGWHTDEEKSALKAWGWLRPSPQLRSWEGDFLIEFFLPTGEGCDAFFISEEQLADLQKNGIADFEAMTTADMDAVLARNKTFQDELAKNRRTPWRQ
ncbi:MAG: hypothetical protein R3E68_20165 [Burkholderiaceae bacterium]